MKINANNYDFRLFIIKYDLNVRYPGGMLAEKNSDVRHPDKVENLNSTCIWRQFPLTSGCMILCGFFYLF